MNTQTPFAILSAERSEYLPETNAWRTMALAAQLKHRSAVLPWVRPVEGHYRGVAEQSFLVLLPAGENGPGWSDVVQLAGHWGQESILYVDANRQAHLVFLEKDEGKRARSVRAERIGRWSEIDLHELVPLSYTVSEGRAYAAL